MESFDEKVQEWLRLSGNGQFIEARRFYYDQLFNDIINGFVAKNDETNVGTDVLFSMLGYSPEPIVLTQRALKAKENVIFYHNVGNDFNDKIKPVLDRFLQGNFRFVELTDLSFGTIYSTLKEQMNITPASNYAIDITGGKKSMVASASIFARDFNFKVLYVDYDEYMPDLRRPMPGSETLNIVYDYLRDLPEIDTLSQIIRQQDTII